MLDCVRQAIEDGEPALDETSRVLDDLVNRVARLTAAEKNVQAKLGQARHELLLALRACSKTDHQTQSGLHRAAIVPPGTVETLDRCAAERLLTPDLYQAIVRHAVRAAYIRLVR